MRGPLFHEVRVALPEGDHFADSGRLIADHASVPDAVVATDGRLLLYFVNGYSDSIWVAASETRDDAFRFQPVVFAGSAMERPVDPCPIVGSDGTVWLYAMERCVVYPGFETMRIRVARSADGLRFEADPTVCLEWPGITDPDVFRLPDGQYVMHVSQGRALWRAVSDDGVSFQWDAGKPLSTEGAVSKTVEHEPGRFRLYCSASDGIRYHESGDGLAWPRESKLGLAPVRGGAVADPAPVRFADGWRLYYKRAKPAGAPPPPDAFRQGPLSHKVISARSDDGERWVWEPGLRLEAASVPAPLMLEDGRVLVYYVDAIPGNPETANVAVSPDGLSFVALGLTIEGSPFQKALDPAPLILPDGRVRLYFLGGDAHMSPRANHVIASAVSRDGVHFTYEGNVLTAPGLVDPDVFLAGGVYRMLVFGDGATLTAESDAGLDFQVTGQFPIPGWGTTRPVEVQPGRWWLFAFSQREPGMGRAVRRFKSSDGVNWEPDSGDLLVPPPGWEVTDPHVVAQGGRWRMYLKLQGTPGPRPASW